MDKLRTIAALVLASAMSTAWGILIPHVASRIADHSLMWWQYGVGLVFAHLPDADAVVEKFVRGRISGAHKKGSLSHYPLLVLPLVFLVASYWSDFWAIIGTSILLFHYLEDSIVPGPGICWLWPLDRRWFCLIRFDGRRLALVKALTEQEVAREHEVTLEQWLKRDFFRLSQQAFVNLAVLIVAMAVVLLWR